MKTPLFTILCLLLMGCSSALEAQVPDYNLSFEHWDNTTMTSDSANFNAYPWIHQVANPYQGKLLYGWHSTTHYWRTTDAYSGQYALVLNQWYNGAKIWFLMGSCPAPSSNDSCRVPTPQKVYGLSGYYKFFPDSTAVGIPKLTIITYKVNSATQTMYTLTHDTLVFPPAASYTGFNLRISDTSALPDSMAVRIDITGPFTPNIYSNFLYLDTLQFHYQPYTATGFIMPGRDSDWNIYPNPASTMLYIAHNPASPARVGLYSAEGKKLREITWPATRQLDLSRLPDGMYNVKVWNEQAQLQCCKKIVVHH